MSSSSLKSLYSLPPTETLDLCNALSLIPRIKLLLTFYRSDPSVKPIDEWQLKLSLLSFLKTSMSITVPEEDLHLEKCKDLKKRKRDDPVASATLYIYDLSPFKKLLATDNEGSAKKYNEWKSEVSYKLDGIELNLEGVKFRMSVSVPVSDHFERMKKEWEEFYRNENRGYYSRSMRQQPDTLILEGVPSRWFAEPRVSSKASMLVTHTIFSVLGKIRNLNIVGNDDLGKIMEQGSGQLVSGLQCKIWVQFENSGDFCNAMKILCGHSMQKQQGSRLKANYEVTWDRDGFFRNMPKRTPQYREEESSGRRPVAVRDFKTEVPRLQSQIIRSGPDDVNKSAPPRRFKD
ncbi:hypothetical protein AMTRI_Chr12g239270 [Amborella trichopoda]